MNWIIQSVLAMCLFAIMCVLITIEIRKGISLNFIMMVTGICCAIYFGIINFKTGINFSFSASTVAIVILIAILSIAGNVFQFRAAAVAPNAGLAFAIVGCQSMLVIITAMILMGDKLTLTQGAGAILSLSGIILISTGK